MKRTGSLEYALAIAFIVAALLLCGCIAARSDLGGVPEESAQSVAPTPGSAEMGEVTPSDGQSDTGYTAPRIAPSANTTYDYRSLSVLFRKDGYVISIPVNMSVYEGARAAHRGGIQNLTDAGDPEALCDYYVAMIEDPTQDELYAAISDSLQQISRRGNLNQDEYVELAMQFVQQIPPDAGEARAPRYPIEVIGDARGTRHEKTLLLLGLLASEGYDVAMLYFPEIDRSGVGIRIYATSEASFPYYEHRARKYLFIEPEHPAFLGECPNETRALQPLVRPVGNGTLRYTRVNEAVRLVHCLEKLNATVAFMSGEIQRIDGDIKNLTKKLRTESYSDDDEALKDIVKREQMKAKLKYYTESLDAIRSVQAFVLDNRHDARGALWMIDNSKVLDIHYY